MSTTTPRIDPLPRCVSCGHFKINHASTRKGPRPRRCLAKGCECPGYADADTVARAAKKAAAKVRPFTQTSLDDPGGEE